VKRDKLVKIRESIFELPVGSVKPGANLASLGVKNMGELCNKINAHAQATNCSGKIMRVKISVNPRDRSYNFSFKTIPTVVLLKEKSALEKGSANAKNEIGKISYDAIKEIAAYKMPDLNVDNLENAIKMISGTAKSLGLTIIN
jgi:large subunit ribosomal protein L11